MILKYQSMACGLWNSTQGLLLMCLLIAFSTEMFGKPDSVVFTDCRLAAMDRLNTLAAKCAWLPVAENPAQPDMRRINLKVAKIPALTSDSKKDPLTVISGGPGGSSIEFYTLHAQAFFEIARSRDILLIDQRGTGDSNPLDCAKLQPLRDKMANDTGSAIISAAGDCHAALQADTRYYTTSVAVQDIDYVRQKLGYEKLNIYGISYGTRVALHYMRRYPQQTRAVILDAVLPPEVILGPEIAVNSQQALDIIVKRCADDEFCNMAYPVLGRELGELLSRLRQQSITVKVQDSITQQFADQQLTEEDLLNLLRLMVYRTETASILPQLIYQAKSSGHYAPLKMLAMQYTDQLSDQINIGMHNSIICTEDIPFLNETSYDKEKLSSTYLGTRLLDYLQAVCKAWPAGIMDADLKHPLKSSIPALLLSGSADPITPPVYAEQVVKGLSNAVHLVGLGQGHGLLLSGCVSKLMQKFIETASPAELDTRCMDDMRADPFFINPNGSIP
jgi:pimeloyl-ACP methyl ester carboxylesterase